ncbi:hypothetical protein [Streptococcus suis]|uniref:hypothetical protein n=1 Tax=Streptococcus suis TaxID=1307 RepID=UPI001ABEC13D|nr:hypothetical protein [Streptococcus suis]
MMNWLKSRTFGEQWWLGFASCLLGMILAWLTKINYLANLGCASYAMLILAFPKMPNRTRLTEREEKTIRLVAILALVLFLFVFRFDVS